MANERNSSVSFKLDPKRSTDTQTADYLSAVGRYLNMLRDYTNTAGKSLTVGVVSGGFDPLHHGHIELIEQARDYCNYLVVIVNGDWFLEQKKGKAFMPLAERCKIVAALKQVDIVVPYETTDDMTVCEPLSIIRPDVFLNGGDRKNPEDIPETAVCEKYNITMHQDIGGGKIGASSDLLFDWGAYAIQAVGGDKEKIDDWRVYLKSVRAGYHGTKPNGTPDPGS